MRKKSKSKAKGERSEGAKRGNGPVFGDQHAINPSTGPSRREPVAGPQFAMPYGGQPQQPAPGGPRPPDELVQAIVAMLQKGQVAKLRQGKSEAKKGQAR